MRVDHPPPVLSQNPHWRPGSMSPNPMRSQWLMWPSAHGEHTGEKPRVTQLRTGTTMTRVPSSRSPTTSWPGVNGKDTIGSNQREEVPSIVARSEPQMPARRGRTRTQPGPGSSGASRSRRAIGPTLAPPPGVSRPASMAAANLAGFRENTSAFTWLTSWRPSRHDGCGDDPRPVRSGAGGSRRRRPCRSAPRANRVCGPAPPGASPG